MGQDSVRVTRRAVLRGGGVLTLAVLVPFGRTGPPGAGVAIALEEGAGFLTDDELRTLRAVVDRFVPGPPEDPDPGAVDAGCAEAIDALLAAFDVDPPRIYAGAPFSDRAGHPVNHFEEFLPLDAYEQQAWRLRILGSRGRRELEFNGPVKGYRAIYRDGLAAADEVAGGSFADLPGPMRDVILRGSDDTAIRELVDVAFPQTLEFMYGAPEYGGNRDLVSWKYTNFQGDVQPRGWTREEVENRDDGAVPPVPSVPPSVDQTELVTLAALAAPEAALGMVARSGGRLSGMQAELRAVLDSARKVGDGA